MASPLMVQIGDSGGSSVSIGGGSLATPGKQSFTRPADTTAYAGGDLIANSTTAASVAAIETTGATASGDGGSGEVAGLLIATSGTAAAQVRAHAFSAAPTVTNGDNGAIAVSSFDADSYLGSVDVSVADGVNGGKLGFASGSLLSYVLDSGDSVFWLLESLGAFTPTSGATWTLRPTFRRY